MPEQSSLQQGIRTLRKCQKEAESKDDAAEVPTSLKSKYATIFKDADAKVVALRQMLEEVNDGDAKADMSMALNSASF